MERMIWNYRLRHSEYLSHPFSDALDSRSLMKNIHNVIRIVEWALGGFRSDFNGIMKAGGAWDSIKEEYSDWMKNADHWNLHSRYSDYGFLSALSDFERNRLIFAYSLLRYALYLEEMEDMWLWKEYFLYLIFELESDPFPLKGDLLFPSISYRVTNAADWKMGAVEWHNEIDFWKRDERIQSYLERIAGSLGAEMLIDISSYHAFGEPEASVDFNFAPSEFKKRKIAFHSRRPME